VITGVSSYHGDDSKNSSVEQSIISDTSAVAEEALAPSYEKADIIDTNTESSPENMVQAQTRPPRRIMHRHTYSFSRDVSIAANNTMDDPALPEDVIHSQSVSVSFKKKYTPIEKGELQSCHATWSVL
jgi:hypothetical protein